MSHQHPSVTTKAILHTLTQNVNSFFEKFSYFRAKQALFPIPTQKIPDCHTIAEEAAPLYYS